MIKQFLFFSKRKEIIPANGWNIDGWIINIFLDKNKNAASKHEISVVFDKRCGIDPFWSEVLFLSEYTPTEEKYIKEKMDPFLPLCFTSSGAWTQLSVTDPLTGEVFEYGNKFYKKNSRELYNKDPEFKYVFDKCVEISCRERIIKGLLRIENLNNNEISDMKDNKKFQKNNIEEKDDKSYAPSSEDSLIEESVVLEE